MATGGILGAGRRANNQKLKHSAAHKVVREFHERAEQERAIVQKLIFDYDEDGSGILDQDQLTKLLKDYSLATFGRDGTPTKEDIDCLEALCAHPNKETTLASVQEIIAVLDVWFAYIEKAPQVSKWLDKFDKSGTGTLDGPQAMGATYSMKANNRCELRPLLVELNGGQEVPDEVVQWVWEVGDVQGNGSLNRFELTKAIAAWYAWADKAWFDQDEKLRHPNALKDTKVPQHIRESRATGQDSQAGREGSCTCAIS